MKTHKSLNAITVLAVLCLSGFSLADSITRTNTIFSRPDANSIDPQNLLTVHFIDVGGGDAILIDTPSDKKILIDGGWTYADRGLAKKEYSAYIERFLGDNVIDLAIISHPDYDHFAGLLDILDTHTIRQIWYTGYDSDNLSNSNSWNTLVGKIKAKEDLLYISPIGSFLGLGSIVRFDDSETDTSSDDVVLTIINSKRWLSSNAYGSGRHLSESKRRNSSSLVVRLDYGNTSFLFTGDTNGRNKDSMNQNDCDDQELFMVTNNNTPNSPLYNKLDCTVLKVPHHGSNGSSSLAFLKAAKPKWAVISAGVYHDHPDPNTINRLKDTEVGLDDMHILRTDDGEDNNIPASEANLGDDCLQFLVDPNGIVKIENWKVYVN